MKRFLALILSLLMVLSCFSAMPAFGYEEEGKCGVDAYYTYDMYTRTLTITGSGELYTSNCTNDDDIRETAKHLIIEEGITELSFMAFKEFLTLKDVTMPDSVTRINNACFSNCRSLTDIRFSNNLVFIGGGAFGRC